MRIDGPQITGSLSLNGDGLQDLDALVTTSSLNTYTSSVDTTMGHVMTATHSLNTFTSSADSRMVSIESKTGSYATTGSNIFIGTQTISGSIIPSVDNTYDLGSTTHQFRDLYLSSASLYIDGTKVLSSTTQELQITTDAGQSFKILEAGSDTITLQSGDGNITLASSGGGDVILDPTNGVVALKGTVTVYSGNKVISSDGNAIHIGDDIVISGSILSTGTPLVSGSEQISSLGFATTGSNTFNGNLTVTGYIDAQELRTTYISSSILYRSGSTKFGDESTDTHDFTGSLNISGSLSTTGNVNVNSDGIVVNRSTSGEPYIFFRKDGTNRGSIYGVTGGGLRIFDESDNQVLTITGSKVGVGINSPLSLLHISGSNSSDQGLFINTTGTGNDFYAIKVSTGTSSDVFSVTNAARVGVGTNDPAQKFHVSSTGVSRLLIENTDNQSTGAGIQMLVKNGVTTVGNGTIRTDNSDNMQFFNLGGERVRIIPGGELLVGSQSRVTGLSGFTQLEVSGNEGGITINSNTTTSNKYSRLMFTKSGSTGNEGLIRYNVNDYHMSLWTNATEQVRVTSTGAVGMGTENPLGSINNNGLHVDRGGHTTLMIGDGSNDGGVIQSSDNIRRIFMGANIYDDVSNAWSQFVDAGAFAAFDAIGGESGLARILVGSPADSGYASSNIFFEASKNNSGSYLKLRTNTDNVIYLNNGGYIGLGTDAPTAPLVLQTPGNTVDGTYFSSFTIKNTGASTISRLRFDRNTSAKWGLTHWLNDSLRISNLDLNGTGNADDTTITILNNNNVGLGTDNPTEKLQVNGWIRILTDKGIKFDSSGSSGDPLIQIDSNAAFSFKNTASVETFRISNGGNVTTPNQPAWSVGLSSAQFFSTSTPNTINWNQSSGNDCFIQGDVTLNTSNGRITVPVAGKYMIFASIRTEAVGAAEGTNLSLRRNGTTLQRHYVGGAVNSAGSFMYIETRPIIISCGANDYIDFYFDSVANDFNLSSVTNTVVRFGGFLMG